MSESDDGPGRREVAGRLFAAEFDDATLSYSESDEERAPNYVVTPGGARVNRLFVVGVLTEIEEVSEGVLRARVVDPTGAFVLYAGQYQPDERAFLERAEPPLFVAVTGKARTFQPDDADTIYTSVRPESISEVDADTRDRWVVDTAEHTLNRVAHVAAAAESGKRGDALEAVLLEQGYDQALAAGIARALDHYGTTGTYLGALRDLALEAARVVAGETEEAEPLAVAPDEGDDRLLATLAETGPDVAQEPAATEQDTPAAEEPEPIEAETGTPRPSESAQSTEQATTAADHGESESDGTSGPDPSEEDSPEDAEVDDIGEFEPGEFELDEDEREEIEDEFGTEFQSGTEVDEPGEADIDTPDPDTGDDDDDWAGASPDSPDQTDEAEAPDTTSEPSGDQDADGDPEAAAERGSSGDESEPSGEDAAAEDDSADTVEDLEEAVVDLMDELDDGDGVGRSALTEAATDRFGVGADEVEEAIQDALMGGRCYEPDETTLKPI